MPHDVIALNQKLRDVFNSNLTLFLEYTHARREELERNRNYALVSFFIVVMIVVLLYVLTSTYTTTYQNTFFNILVGALMVWTTVVLIYGRRWFRTSKLLAREMNMALVPIVSACLDKSVLYTHVDDHREETLAELQATQLMTRSDVDIVADDMYTVHDPQVFFRELQVTVRGLPKYEDGERVAVFRGLFIKAKLKRSLSGVTFISTEADKARLNHTGFWQSLLKAGTIQETILESNAFEADLHVATSDPVEARYILTPDYMAQLHDWWLEHKTNIRIVFRDQYMYMLLPETSIRIGHSTASTREDVIARYALTILLPIWRTLRLVEAVKV